MSQRRSDCAQGQVILELGVLWFEVICDVIVCISYWFKVWIFMEKKLELCVLVVAEERQISSLGLGCLKEEICEICGGLSSFFFWEHGIDYDCRDIGM